MALFCCCQNLFSSILRRKKGLWSKFEGGGGRGLSQGLYGRATKKRTVFFAISLTKQDDPDPTLKRLRDPDPTPEKHPDPEQTL